ncbi:MAG: UbiA prenyltransferase family protein [Fimbriimonadaceae bacterium]|nr:UbiA prenyltransferase family protein [Chitinophagales bacterium]
METFKNKTFIINRDTLLHLRLPFSYFLFPIYCFGISQTDSINWFNSIMVFIVLHFFIYPGSNVYNSFMDEDTGSIGVLKNPPPVTRKLYYASIICDSVGLLLCVLIGWEMFLLMILYIAASKIYSWKRTRIKKYAYGGWALVILFQGAYTFLLVHMSAENNFSLDWFTSKNIFCMLLATLLIGGYYPLTQIYQHTEDKLRGDITISYRLGIYGTFIFTGILFLLACAVAFYYFTNWYYFKQFILFMACLFPVILYYFYWFAKTLNDKKHADFSHTMRMTFISSTCMIICFIILFFLNHK